MLNFTWVICFFVYKLEIVYCTYSVCDIIWGIICSIILWLYQSHNNLIVLLIDTLESIKKNLIQYNKIAIAVVKLRFIFTMS